MKARMGSGTIVSTIAGGLSSSDEGSRRTEARADTIEAMMSSLATWVDRRLRHVARAR